MHKKIIILFILIINIAYSQNNIEFVEPLYIKSVTLHAKKINAFIPIIRLGESFSFSFDDTEGDEKEYTYKLIHCNADWEISNLLSTEFISGFDEDTIRNYENSFNTYQDYTHYDIQIPNQTMRIKISGNYIISISDDDGVVFTRRFIMYQKKVDVGVSVHKARKVEDINTKQNVEFVINYPKLKINNPSKEIKIAIYKNNDWNTVVKNIEPQFYRGTQLLYKYGEKTSFLGGNEFIYFDTKDYRSTTNNINKVELGDVYETTLYVDVTRQQRDYTYYPDVNGNFFIRSINAEDNNLEADYTKVHFIYRANIPNEKEVYVYGAFNNWQFTNENKLQLTTDNYYETDVLLKQGFYNYTYVTLDNDGHIDQTIEGTHYQTENDYTVIVYYRRFGSRYDSVIGYGIGNSENLQN